MTKATTPAWRRYLRFWRADIVSDVDDELNFHMEMRIKEFMARGMSEDEARRAAAERIGDVDAAKSACVELGELRQTHAQQADFLEGLLADVRYAFRSLARAPGWSAVALLTIAIGVGATTTVFSVADTFLVRPITYPGASRVYIAKEQFSINGGMAGSPLPVSVAKAWRDNAHTIEAAMPYRFVDGQLGKGAEAVSVRGAMIDTGFLAFAGVHPLLGRNFTAADIGPAGSTVVMLGEQFWRTHYGASRDVVGKVEDFGNGRRTIIGVAPASLVIPDFGIEASQVFVPLSTAPSLVVNGVIVRLKPGVSAAAAQTELDAIFTNAHIPMPSFFLGKGSVHLDLTRPQDNLKIRRALLLLVGAVGLLLLVACSNIAHLLLARGAARQRELAVRHALGAARRRLVRQLVTESVVLVLFGGALAAVVGWAGLQLLTALRPADLVELSHVSTHRGVLSIAAMLAIVCGLGIGLLAALRTAHTGLADALRVGTSSTLAQGRRLRSSLVIGEVALSATLLVGALLLIHAVFDLQRTRLGFDADGLYAASIRAPDGPTAGNRDALVSQLRERAASIPGIEGLTVASSAPTPRYWRELAVLETPEHPAIGDSLASNPIAANFVAPDYFAVLRMPLVAGHTFDAGSAERNEVIVSQSLAHQLWPESAAIGHTFRNAASMPGAPPAPWLTVIGVVPDMVEDLLESGGRPASYQPLESAGKTLGPPSVTLIARLSGSAPAESMKRLVALEQGSSVPPAVVQSVSAQIDESMAKPRFVMRILVMFAAVAVLLAAIGLFGVISYSVSQRTREIGVRMTLGATRPSIARLVVGDGVRLALAGIVLGLAGAVAATRLLQSSLYGVSRLDPFSFGVGAALLLAVAVVACVVPMLRATGVDPAIAVRVE
ncbi:MAG TPA: ADOP family duplicated permease [Gemmatimonadaceae bacterium]|jgi:predicted permease